MDLPWINREEAFGEELNGPKPLFTARLSASRENLVPRSLLCDVFLSLFLQSLSITPR